MKVLSFSTSNKCKMKRLKLIKIEMEIQKEWYTEVVQLNLWALLIV